MNLNNKKMKNHPPSPVQINLTYTYNPFTAPRVGKLLVKRGIYILG